MTFIHKDFLLLNEPAKRLYHEYSRDEPIYDYHCHLLPQDLANNRRFENLSEIWLEGDHYKWRAMRTNGISEDLCTGNADPYQKFLAFCKTVPHSLRNPLYHWSHIELKRVFDIDLLINESNAPAIWEQANAKLAEPSFCAHGILEKFKVKVIGTTDDPTDSLEHHLRIKKLGLDTTVVPTFRPDKSMQVDNPEAFNQWVESLEVTSNTQIVSYRTFLEALEKRHCEFHNAGARLSDHGLEHCHYVERVSQAELESIFRSVRRGKAASADEKEAFAFSIMRAVGEWNFEKGWTMQLHLGALRNNNTRLYSKLGPDIGCDSIGDFPQTFKLSRFLDCLDRSGKLPKTILYNLNDNNNYPFAAMIGNFQDGSIPGKIQFGSGWWFLDQKDGIINQLNALSQLGLLSRFVGMLTDSRSFLSYPRHEYFRRILCNLLGEDMINGGVPDDFDLIGDLVKRISYQNAADYFKI
ncbi:MAG: glucuronate isomerase [Verrucomicrobiota bacterium]